MRKRGKMMRLCSNSGINRLIMSTSPMVPPTGLIEKR